jgi:hypothetical protein
MMQCQQKQPSYKESGSMTDTHVRPEGQTLRGTIAWAWVGPGPGPGPLLRKRGPKVSQTLRGTAWAWAPGLCYASAAQRSNAERHSPGQANASETRMLHCTALNTTQQARQSLVVPAPRSAVRATRPGQIPVRQRQRHRPKY